MTNYTIVLPPQIEVTVVERYVRCVYSTHCTIDGIQLKFNTYTQSRKFVQKNNILYYIHETAKNFLVP